MTTTNTEMDIISLLELEGDRPCTPWYFDCDRSADWLFITKCCGVEVPMCDPHFQPLIKRHSEHAGNEGKCDACGVNVIMGSACYRVVKLK